MHIYVNLCIFDIYIYIVYIPYCYYGEVGGIYFPYWLFPVGYSLLAMLEMSCCHDETSALGLPVPHSRKLYRGNILCGSDMLCCFV